MTEPERLLLERIKSSESGEIYCKGSWRGVAEALKAKGLVTLVRLGESDGAYYSLPDGD